MTETTKTEELGAPWLPEDSIELLPSEAEVLAILAAYMTADPVRDPEGFCREARRAAEKMPRRITELLWDFGRWGTRSGSLTISGIPVGRVPQTPLDNRDCLAAAGVAARVQAMFNETLGHMVAYEAEGGGRIFQDMAPSPLAARLQTSLSSEVELEVHTEQAFSELRPDYLSLACLREDLAAQTYLFTARDLAARCDERLGALLRRPLWTTEVDESFRTGGIAFEHGDRRGPMPILSGAADDPFIVFDQDLMRGADRAAQDALRQVIALYLEHRKAVVLRTAQVMIIDNHRTVHGRSPFAARFDGTDRFVARSFVITDLTRTRHAREADSRVIAGRFS
jgi:L-asparagine oxygenase